MSSGGGDSESALTKKKGRGPTTIKRVINKSNKEVKFDTLGRTVINEDTRPFSTQLGILVRAHVPIVFRQWGDVSDLIKEKIWQDLKLGWKLPDDDVDLKKEITSHMGVLFRRFRRTLNKDYLLKGVSPFGIYNSIEPEHWAAFVEYHQSEEFQNLSRQGKKNQEKNLYPHLLGNRGYAGQQHQKRLRDYFEEIAKETQGDVESCGSTSQLSEEQLNKLEVEHRHISWRLAREKVLENGELHHPNPETKEMIKTIEEKAGAFKEGMLTPDRYDDILGKSLKNPEHPGRVRGVGSLVGIKKAYATCGKRKRQTSSESEASIEQRIQREVAERVQEVEEKMKAVMELVERQGNQIIMLMGQGALENRATNTTGAVQSQTSCPSVQSAQVLDLIEEERSCRLHLVRDGQRIQVAVGTIYAGTVIHGRPVPPGHVRVMVDDYGTGEDETPVPVPNDEVATLRSARSSFTAWPKDMISLDEEPIKEAQVPPSGKSVHTDGFEERHEYKGFQNIEFDALGPIFKSLRDRFLKQDGNEFQIAPPIDLFHSDDAITVHADDFQTLITPEAMLTGSILQIFMMYAHKNYKDEYHNELVGFMDPGKTCGQFLSGDAQDQKFVEDYIIDTLKANRDKKIIFLPYHEGQHWILLALMPAESTFYVFDSTGVRLPKKVYLIMKALEGPFLVDSYTGGPGKTRWKRSNVKCPQQVGSWECGYYVMLFVYDIITRFLDVFPNLTHFPKGYTTTNIDYIRTLWGKFFSKEVLGMKSNSI